MLDVPTARSLLRETRPGRSADGYPPETRTQVTALARSLLASGQSRNAVAHQLGLHGGTLRRWLQLPVAEALSFVPVLVDERDPEALGEPDEAQFCLRGPSVPGLALTSPTGFRLEGLTLDDAVTALRRLS
jgi:hypothetical protein